MKLDSIDVKILKLLLEDSRVSHKRIAELLKLSRPTVKSRIEKLVEKGVIEKFTIKLGKEAIKENIILFIRTSSVNEKLFEMEEIIEIYRVTGEKAFLLKAVVGSIKEAGKLADKLKELSGDITVEIALENLKSEEEEPAIKAEYTCDYCGSTSYEPIVFKHRNVEHYFCCPVCLKNFRRAIREKG